MSTANTMASSLECASPESIMDPTSVSPASDQYSLGCVLYYCLTGQYPFPGNNAVEKMMLHQTREPQPITELVPEVPPELAAIASRLMAKNPADRYPSMGDVVIALRPFAASGYAQASAPAAPAPRPMAPPRPTMAPPAPPQPAYAPPPPAPAWGGGGMGDNGAMEGPGSGMDAPHMPAPRGRQPAMDLNNPPPPPPPPSRPAPLSMPPFPDLGGNPQFSMPPVPSAPLPPPPQFGMPGGGLGQPGPGGFPPPPGGAPVWNQFPNQPPGPMGDPSGFGRHQGTSGGNSNKILVIGLAVAGVLIVALGGAVVWLLMNK
jgi:serine/threonine-protein kinase